jgi:hypothetical protein
MDTKTIIIETEKSGIYLRPTPGTPPMGVRHYRSDPPNLPERDNSPRRALFWQPED